MKRFKLSTQFLCALGILVAVMVVTSAASAVVQRKAWKSLSDSVEHRIESIGHLDVVAASYAVDIVDAVNKANAGLMTLDQTVAAVATARATVQTNWARYMRSEKTVRERAVAMEAEMLLNHANSVLDRLPEAVRGKSGFVKGALSDFDGPLYGYIDPITKKMAELEDIQSMEANAASFLAKERLEGLMNLSLGLTAAGILLGCGFGWYMVRSTTAILQSATEQLSAGAARTAFGAREMAAASQTLAKGASEQAASLEETSASLEEISAMTKRNAASASSSKSLSQKARESATNGLERIVELGRTLQAVKHAVGEMESAVREMQSSSMEIAKIIKTIDEIAFQTNLLALNAAVEAARAGEAGLGFAVVADEVRSLAQRSAQAAKDTSDKIEAAVRRSELGGAASGKVVRSLIDIERLGGVIEQTFSGIVGDIKSLDEVIGEINVASHDQSQGVNEVNLALNQMDSVTQSNAATAEENASAAEQLNAQVAALDSIVHTLRTVIAGAGNLTAAQAEEESLLNGDASTPASCRPRLPRPETTSVPPVSHHHGGDVADSGEEMELFGDEDGGDRSGSTSDTPIRRRRSSSQRDI